MVGHAHTALRASARVAITLCLALACCGLIACGDSDDTGAGTNNASTNNAGTSTNNGTSTSTNNGTSTSTNGATTSTNNDTTDVGVDTDLPDTDEPDVDEPDTDEPDTDLPDTDEPDVDEPDVDEPDTDLPDTDEPDVDEPDADEPDTDLPDTDEPDTDEPDTDLPDTDEPDADIPDADEPDADPGDAELDAVADADEPDAEPDVFDEDVEVPPRPDEIVGGVSAYEFTLVANVLITVRVANVSASFTEPIEPDEPVDTIGGCDVIDNGGIPFDPVGYDAGMITVNRSGFEDATITSDEFFGSWTYPNAYPDGQDDVFDPDTLLTITAAGGLHIPFWEAQVQTPDEHFVTTPRADSTVSASADLTVAWQSFQEASDRVLVISQFDNNYNPLPSITLSCPIPADAPDTTFTIPAAAMGRLTGPRLSIVVAQTNTTTTASGDQDSFTIGATYAHGVFVSLDP